MFQGLVKEGAAKILTQYKSNNKTHQVFYNPAQQLNRNLSLLGIKVFMKNNNNINNNDINSIDN